MFDQLIALILLIMGAQFGIALTASVVEAHPFFDVLERY